MTGHIMGPSAVPGFRAQCVKCKALDTEIRFALGDLCPGDVYEEQPATEVVDVPPRLGKLQSVPVYLAASMQQAWFEGYFLRQYLRAQQH